MKAKLICIVLLTIVWTSCDTSDTNNSQRASTIEEEFLPFYLSFIEEMDARGVNLATRPISIIGVNTLSESNNGQFCAYGYPSFGNSGNARVEVITNYNCWNKRSYIEKENLMFHEFGHALLARNHYSALMPNGSPRSIMCTQICSNYGVYNAYQPEQRSYYLDELANSQVSAPSWATTKSLSSILYEDNIDNSLDGWISETVTENGTILNNPYTYFVETNSVFSEPNALGISSITNSEINAGGNWQKDINLENFDYCANLIVKVDLKYQNLTNGYVAVIVDLYDDTNSDIKFARYYKLLSSTLVTSTDQYENFEVNVTCLPLETAYIKIRLYLETQSSTSAYFDNLEVKLYD